LTSTLKISTGIKIKKEDDSIWISSMVCFKCIGKSSVLRRRVSNPKTCRRHGN